MAEFERLGVVEFWEVRGREVGGVETVGEDGEVGMPGAVGRVFRDGECGDGGAVEEGGEDISAGGFGGAVDEVGCRAGRSGGFGEG